MYEYVVPGVNVDKLPKDPTDAPASTAAISDTFVPEGETVTGFRQFASVLPVSHNSTLVIVISYFVAGPLGPADTFNETKIEKNYS
jgi:hypothetical protein